MAQLRALWWWIDRWRKSTAYTDMSLEEQGAYRNLLDEQTLRGGAIPNDERILARACGDALAWERVRGAVLARFELTPEGWQNATLREVNAKGERLSAVRSEAGKRGNVARWADRKTIANSIAKPSHQPSSPSPSPIKEQGQGESWRIRGLYVSPKMHAIVTEGTGKWGATVDYGALYSDAADDYAEHGEPANVLADLKRRANKAAAAERDRQTDPLAIADARHKANLEQWARERMTPEQRKVAAAKLRAIMRLRPEASA